MSAWVIALRRSTMVRLLPVALLGGWAVWSQGHRFWTYRGLDAAAHAGTAVLLMAPVGAGAAAWDAGRWRRAHAPDVVLGTTRHPLAIQLVEVSAGLTWLTVAYLAIVAVHLWSASNRGSWSWLVVIDGIAVLGAAAALGSLAGTVLPRFTAAAVAVIAAYLALALPGRGPHPGLANLVADRFACCGIDQSLPTGVLWEQLTWLAGVAAVLLVGAAMLRSLRTSRALLTDGRRWTASIALIGITAGALTIHPLLAHDPDGLEPRTRPSDVPCRSAEMGPLQVTVCSWPEHRALLGPTSVAAAEVVRAYERSTLAVPHLLVEGEGLRPTRSLAPVVPLLDGDDSDAYRERLASALLPEMPHCAVADPAGDAGVYTAPGLAIEPYLVAWVMAQDGRLDAARAVVHPFEGVLTVILGAAAEQQRRWFAYNVEVVRRCDLKPRFVP